MPTSASLRVTAAGPLSGVAPLRLARQLLQPVTAAVTRTSRGWLLAGIPRSTYGTSSCGLGRG
jgi:hypothetical protein